MEYDGQGMYATLLNKICINSIICIPDQNCSFFSRYFDDLIKNEKSFSSWSFHQRFYLVDHF
jgi:hypothetical protein